MNKVIFSGIQPSGNLHIGNYIGAIRQWIKLQKENETIFCVVDLHAITVNQDPKSLRENILEVAALYLACGIDPKKSKIFIQSENPDHTYLAWIFDCITPFGWLNRMTQFKDKSKKAKSLLDIGEVAKEIFEQELSYSAGLFNYPALMAADILLYNTDQVPVGEDQKQHIELARDIAEKFNKTYGNVFKLPEPLIQKRTARIMSLQNPSAKMSKSDSDPQGTINIVDSEDEINKKLRRAVTDSNNAVNKEDIEKSINNSTPNGMANLLTIYSAVSNKDFSDVLNSMNGKQYGQIKQEVADSLISVLKPIQTKYREIREDRLYLNKVLDDGRNYSLEKSSQTLRKVKEEAMGIGR